MIVKVDFAPPVRRHDVEVNLSGVKMLRYLSFALSICATQSFALSCAPNSPQAMYQLAAAVPDRYQPVLGQFDFDARTVQSVESQTGGRVGKTFTAKFSGQALTRSGFTRSFDNTVTVQIGCVSALCGSLQPDTPTLALLWDDGANYTLNVMPCSWDMEASPSDQMVNDFVTCRQGGSCTVPN